MNDRDPSFDFEGNEEIQNKVKSHEKKLSDRLSYTDEIAFVAVLVIFGVAIVMSSGSGFPTEFFPEEVTAASSEPEALQIVLDDERASPNRPEIRPEEEVKFVNNASYDLKLEFTRNVENFTLEQGEASTVNATRILYYTAAPVDESVEFREIHAGINVQPGNSEE